jgi:hypothetical protein
MCLALVVMNNASPRPAAVNDDVRHGTAVQTGVQSRSELTFKDGGESRKRIPARAQAAQALKKARGVNNGGNRGRP